MSKYPGCHGVICKKNFGMTLPNSNRQSCGWWVAEFKYSVCSFVQIGSSTILLHIHSCAYDESQRGRLAISMKEIEDSTGGCLKFRPKTDVDHGWIRINGEKGVRCSADLGYQEGGKQNVNLEASRCVGDAFKKKYLLIRRHCIVGCL